MCLLPGGQGLGPAARSAGRAACEVEEMLRFFDCEIGVGGTGYALPVADTPEKLLSLMDRYAIRKALVYDRGAVESGRDRKSVV